MRIYNRGPLLANPFGIIALGIRLFLTIGVTGVIIIGFLMVVFIGAWMTADATAQAKYNPNYSSNGISAEQYKLPYLRRQNIPEDRR